MPFILTRHHFLIEISAAIILTTCSAFGGMLSLRNLFYGYNNRCCNLCTANVHFHVSYNVFLQTTYTGLCITKTKFRLNLVNKSLMLRAWNHRIHRGKIPNLRKATKQPLHMNRKILLHERFGAQWVRLWLSIVPNLAVALILGTSFIDLLICNIFSSRGDIVPTHFPWVALLVSSQAFKSLRPTIAAVNTLVGDTHEADIEIEEIPASIRMARKPLLQLPAECFVFFATSTSDMHTVEPNILEGAREITFAAHGVVDVVLTQPFHILISNFSAKAVQHLNTWW